MLPAWATNGAPAIIAAESERPKALQGLHLGDPNASVVVWSRSDRPARMVVEWSYDELFQNARRIVGPRVLDTTDFTARLDIQGLEPEREVFVRIAFESLTNSRVMSEPVGREQLDWLKSGLQNSRATWKVVAADMPIGLNVGDGTTPAGLPRWEAVANGEPGPAKGRELEFTELFSHLKRQRLRNVVWLTADVHYCAAHYYDPARAAFSDFDGFWEFVAGPLNAGSFGPNTLDRTAPRSSSPRLRLRDWRICRRSAVSSSSGK